MSATRSWAPGVVSAINGEVLGLEALDKGNEEYKQMVSRARKHVRAKPFAAKGPPRPDRNAA